jgi:hypothetical protein
LGVIAGAAVMVARVAPASADAAPTRICGATARVGQHCGRTDLVRVRRRVVRRVRHTRVVEVRPNVWMLGPRTVRVCSPATGRSYRMRCRARVTPDSPFYACTGGTSGRVEIRS